MPKDIKDMTVDELLRNLESCIAAKTRHICIYDGARFWEVLAGHMDKVEKFRQAIRARFAALEEKNKE